MNLQTETLWVLLDEVCTIMDCYKWTGLPDEQVIKKAANDAYQSIMIRRDFLKDAIEGLEQSESARHDFKAILCLRSFIDQMDSDRYYCYSWQGTHEEFNRLLVDLDSSTREATASIANCRKVLAESEMRENIIVNMKKINDLFFQ